MVPLVGKEMVWSAKAVKAQFERSYVVAALCFKEASWHGSRGRPPVERTGCSRVTTQGSSLRAPNAFCILSTKLVFVRVLFSYDIYSRGSYFLVPRAAKAGYVKIVVVQMEIARVALP